MNGQRIPIKAKPETILFVAIWAIITVFSIVALIVGTTGRLMDVSFFLTALLNALFLLPSVLPTGMVINHEGIVIERRLFKPISLPFATFQYAQNGMLVFRGYVLKPDDYQNKEELLEALNRCRESGLFNWAEREGTKPMKTWLRVLLFLGLALLVALFVYFGIVLEDLNAFGIVMISILALITIVLGGKAIYLRHLRTRKE